MYIEDSRLCDMKKMINRNARNIVLLGMIIMYICIHVFLVYKNNLKFIESMSASFSICLTFVGGMLLGFRKNINKEGKNHFLKITGIILLLYFLITYVVGVAIGFLKNSYSLTFSSIFDNTFNIFVSIIFIELFRYIFVSSNKDKKFQVGVVTVLLSILEILLFVKTDSFDSVMNAYNFIILSVIPILLKNVMCTYLNWYGDYKAPLLYRLVMDLHFYIVPIQPDFNELINGILLLTLPFLIILFTSRYVDNKIKDSEYEVTKKLFKLSDIPLMIISTCFILMVLGIGPFSLIGIETGSMTPNINIGDAVLVNKMYDSNKLKKGDIIAFYNDDDILVIHRIIEVNKDNTYITKGDHNNAADEGYVKKENIEGKVMLKIPYLAYPTIMFKR